MAQAQIIQAKSKFEEEMWKLADEAMKKPKKKKSENISMENKVKKEQKEEELGLAKELDEKEIKKRKGIFKYIIVGYAIFSFDYIRGI